MWTSEDDAALERAVRTYQRAAVADLAGRLAADLPSRAEPFPGDKAKALMQLLRRKRFFDQMVKLGEALVSQAGDIPVMVHRQYAQALIEKGQLLAALGVLHGLLPRCVDDPDEDAEVRGLIGRTQKQRYVALRVTTRIDRAQVLNAAISAYLEVYRRDPSRFLWHGINVVALARRAERDGVATAPHVDASAIAHDILAKLSAKPRLDAWDHATAAEAHLALGQIDQSLAALGSFVASPDTDAFECASTLRQLEEVWQLRDDGPGGALVVLMRAELLLHEGGQMKLEVGELQTASQGAPMQAAVLEKVFRSGRPMPIAWVQQGLACARSVARIEDSLGRPMGTGFLVKASDFFPQDVELASELVLMTNAHVLGETHADALRVAETAVRFEALDGLRRTVGIREILFESPVAQLDATIARLDASITGVEPIPLAPPEEPTLAAEGKRRHFYVIGHPEGGGLSMSFENSEQVGWKRPLLHYLTPTRAGSSGSPVCDNQWRLVALHHSGNDQMPRLDDKPGVYEANEGIWVHAIVAATRKTPPPPVERAPIVSKAALREGVFISYSHKDRLWLERLQEMMAPVVRNERLVVWDDRRILPGADWAREIEKAIETARVAVMLVSPAFLASRFVIEEEFPRILEAHRTDGLTIVWIPVSESMYEYTPLGSIQASHDTGAPLDLLPPAECTRKLKEIARKIHTASNVSRVQNVLSVADNLSLRTAGMGGSAPDLRASGVRAHQDDSGISVTRGNKAVTTIKTAEVAGLADPEQRLIEAQEETVRRAYERYVDIYPDQQARDTDRRERARREVADLRREMCGELNGMLDFLATKGKRLDDHYQHVRFLCSASR